MSRVTERIRGYVFVLLAAALTGGVSASQPAIDQFAPDFALKSSAGRNLRLSEYRGDVVLLHFWTRSCSRCREQLARIDDLYRARRDDGFVVLSVAITSEPHHVEEIVDSLKLSFPILYDVEKTAARIYDPSSIPLTLLIDQHGRVRHMHRKFRRGDEHEYRAQLDALLAE